MEKVSLPMQRLCIEHLIAFAESHGISESTVAGAKQAALTIGWLERRSETLRALAVLERDDPHLFSLFQEFPGSRIADVRVHGPQSWEEEEAGEVESVGEMDDATVE